MVSEVARERVEAAGLSDLVELVLADFTDLSQKGVLPSTYLFFNLDRETLFTWCRFRQPCDFQLLVVNDSRQAKRSQTGCQAPCSRRRNWNRRFFQSRFKFEIPSSMRLDLCRYSLFLAQTSKQIDSHHVRLWL